MIIGAIELFQVSSRGASETDLLTDVVILAPHIPDKDTHRDSCTHTKSINTLASLMQDYPLRQKKKKNIICTLVVTHTLTGMKTCARINNCM